MTCGSCSTKRRKSNPCKWKDEVMTPMSQYNVKSKRGFYVTDDEKDKMVRLYDGGAGLGITALSERLDRAPDTIRKVLKARKVWIRGKRPWFGKLDEHDSVLE